MGNGVVDAGKAKTAPEARLIGGYDRASESGFQRFDDRNASEPGSGDENRIGCRWAGVEDLFVKWLDFLRETHAVGIEVLRRDVPPLRPRVIAHLTRLLETMTPVIADGGLDRGVAEPGRRHQERPCRADRLQRRDRVRAVGGYIDGIAEDRAHFRDRRFVPALAADHAAGGVADDNGR